MTEPCTLNSLDWEVRDTCRECRHHALLHPMQSELPMSCLACEMEALVEVVHGYEAAMHQKLEDLEARGLRLDALIREARATIGALQRGLP